MMNQYKNLSCQASKPLFLVNGIDLVTLDTYVQFEQSIGKRVAGVFSSVDDEVDLDTDPEIWKQSIPAVPQYCEIAWNNAQRFNLQEENQCIAYAVSTYAVSRHLPAIRQYVAFTI